jgi:hypothetical protein
VPRTVKSAVRTYLATVSGKAFGVEGPSWPSPAPTSPRPGWGTRAATP